MERAYELKKKEIQRLSQPVCGKERGHFDLINLDIVSSAGSGDCFFNSADKSVENFDGANRWMTLSTDYSQGK